MLFHLFEKAILVTVLQKGMLAFYHDSCVEKSQTQTGYHQHSDGNVQLFSILYRRFLYLAWNSIEFDLVTMSSFHFLLCWAFKCMMETLIMYESVYFL